MQKSQSPGLNAPGGLPELLKTFKDYLHKKQAPTIFKDLWVPDDVFERFERFKCQMTPGLQEFLKVDLSKIFWQIYMVGFSEQDAEPTIVFYSDEESAKSIDAFFKQKHLQDTIKESNANFPIHYILEPPRFLSDYVNKVSIWTGVFDNRFFRTSCGLPIMSTSGHSSARATIGGSVIVDGQLFGMSVDHLVSQLVSAHDKSLQNGDNSGTDPSFDASAEPDTSISQLQSDDPESSFPFFDFSEARNIVSVDMSDLSCRKDYSYLDWALVQLPRDFFLPNMIEESKKSWSKEKASKQGLDMIGTSVKSRKGGTEVIIMSGNGYKPAVLKTRMASLLMSPGTHFTDVLTLSPRKGYELQEGDSGSWVVDSDQGQVYGHLVADMADGDGLIVPIEATFKDIKRVTKASSIKLPSAKEIRDIWIRTIADPSGITSAQPASSVASSNNHSMHKLWLASRSFDPEVNRMVQPELQLSDAATSGTLLAPQERGNSAFSRLPENEAMGVEYRIPTANNTKVIGKLYESMSIISQFSGHSSLKDPSSSPSIRNMRFMKRLKDQRLATFEEESATVSERLLSGTKSGTASPDRSEEDMARRIEDVLQQASTSNESAPAGAGSIGDLQQIDQVAFLMLEEIERKRKHT